MNAGTQFIYTIHVILQISLVTMIVNPITQSTYHVRLFKNMTCAERSEYVSTAYPGRQSATPPSDAARRNVTFQSKVNSVISWATSTHVHHTDTFMPLNNNHVRFRNMQTLFAE